MPLLPSPATATSVSPSAKPEPSPEERRRRFDELSLRLRQHESKENVMSNDEYSRVLREAIDLAASFNQTTAGPRKQSAKIAKGKAAPLSLADL